MNRYGEDAEPPLLSVGGHARCANVLWLRIVAKALRPRRPSRATGSPGTLLPPVHGHHKYGALRVVEPLAAPVAPLVGGRHEPRVLTHVPPPQVGPRRALLFYGRAPPGVRGAEVDVLPHLGQRYAPRFIGLWPERRVEVGQYDDPIAGEAVGHLFVAGKGAYIVAPSAVLVGQVLAGIVEERDRAATCRRVVLRAGPQGSPAGTPQCPSPTLRERPGASGPQGLGDTEPPRSCRDELRGGWRFGWRPDDRQASGPQLGDRQYALAEVL